MRRLCLLAMLGLVPSPILAGDTPVLYSVTGVPVTGTDKGIEVFFDRGGPAVESRSLRGAAAPGGGALPTVDTPVGPIAMTSGETDILYARLRAEARRRGLR